MKRVNVQEQGRLLSCNEKRGRQKKPLLSFQVTRTRLVSAISSLASDLTREERKVMATILHSVADELAVWPPKENLLSGS